MKRCPNCGMEWSDADTQCRNCGCLMSSQNIVPQAYMPGAATVQKPQSEGKGALIAIVCVIVAITGFVVLVLSMLTSRRGSIDGNIYIHEVQVETGLTEDDVAMTTMTAPQETVRPADTEAPDPVLTTTEPVQTTAAPPQESVLTDPPPVQEPAVTYTDPPAPPVTEPPAQEQLTGQQLMEMTYGEIKEWLGDSYYKLESWDYEGISMRLVAPSALPEIAIHFAYNYDRPGYVADSDKPIVVTMEAGYATPSVQIGMRFEEFDRMMSGRYELSWDFMDDSGVVLYFSDGERWINCYCYADYDCYYFMESQFGELYSTVSMNDQVRSYFIAKGYCINRVFMK